MSPTSEWVSDPGSVAVSPPTLRRNDLPNFDLYIHIEVYCTRYVDHDGQFQAHLF